MGEETLPGLEPPDLTGLSSREVRIFCLGANWIVGAVLACCAATVRQTSARFPAQSAFMFGEAVAQAFEDLDPGVFLAAIPKRDAGEDAP